MQRVCRRAKNGLKVGRASYPVQPGKHPHHAVVAQQAARHLAKVQVGGSNPLSRSKARHGA